MNEASLLQTVLDAPDEDAPRLVYADWLEEKGQAERAELIRVQIDKERAPPYWRAREAFIRREGELLRDHAAEWVAQAGLGKVLHPEFRRGFVEHAVFDGCANFLRQAPRLFERTPLRSAEVCDTGPSPKFVSSTLLERLRALHFMKDHPEEGRARRPLQALLHSPRLANLRELDLASSRLEEGDLYGFEYASPLARLEVLSLIDTDFAPGEFGSITDCPFLANLRELYLQGQDRAPGVGVYGLGLLRDSPHLKKLEVLDLKAQHLGPDGLEALAGWPGLAGLRSLDLGYAGVSGEDITPGIHALAHSPHWRDLRELDLTCTVYDPQAVEALLSSPKIASLRVLRLSPTGYGESTGDEIALLLARCPYLDDLMELDLEGYQHDGKFGQLLRERFGERLL